MKKYWLFVLVSCTIRKLKSNKHGNKFHKLYVQNKIHLLKQPFIDNYLVFMYKVIFGWNSFSLEETRGPKILK